MKNNKMGISRMNVQDINRLSKSRIWIVFIAFPVLFFPVSLLCVSLSEEYWVRSIKAHASIITKFIPHLQKIREYAIDVGVFDCVLSVAVVSGFLFGVYMIIVLLPRVRLRLDMLGVEKIINIKTYFILFVFCLLSVWFLCFDGPIKPAELPRLLRMVSRSNIGIATYGVMYYFVFLIIPLFISTLVLITPTLFKCLQKRVTLL